MSPLRIALGFSRQRLVAALLPLVLAGCASVSLEETLGRANWETESFTETSLRLVRSKDDEKGLRESADSMLASVVGQKEAVQLAMVNSHSFQALLAQGWADASGAAQAGRIPNPIFQFERIRVGDELELGRLLSFGLLDLLTLPQRKAIADQRLQQAHLQLASNVIDRVTQVRQSWVRAVAAQQSLQYARQVYENAEVSAELARRMEAAGNFNRITRARQQTFYADAASRLAIAQQQVTSTREELIRLLGLDESQAAKLRLPERLPDLPKEPRQPEEVSKVASRQRLDVRLAQAGFDAAAASQGLTTITSFSDIELGIRRDTVFGHDSRSNPRGYEIDVQLPIFDWGGMTRASANAQTLAAAHRLEATVRAAGSHLRNSYSVYRTAYDLVRHYRTEVIPLRKLISDENQLRYNAMLIGVFELLADARDQVSAVIAAINAEQQFWLADASLQASIVGRPPTNIAVLSPGATPAAAADPH